MAGVDLFGNSAQQVRGAYTNYLGRDASDDDVSNWLSGAYGHGDATNLNPVLSAIQNSHEARNRVPPTTQPPVIGTTPNVSTPQTTPNTQYKNIDYWGGQGVPYSDIFDLQSGQIKSGWQRTISGYERMAGGNVSAPQGGDFQGWFNSLTGGKPPTPESLESMAGELAKYGIRLGSKGNRGWTDTIILPDGRTYDVIEAAGIGTGKGWTWNQNGGPGYTAGNGLNGVNMPGDQYSDAYSQLLEQMLKSRMGFLGGGINDPNAALYQDALKQRAGQLGGANMQVDQLMKLLQERFTDLQKPGYTGAENEVLRTQALDPMEQDRNAAKQRVTERLSARGLTPDSGIFQQALLEVDNAFDAMRGETQGALASNELARREDRSQRAQTIGAQLVDIPEARSREQLDVFSALEMLSKTMRGEEDARARESLGYAGVLSDLGPQRLQLALQAMGAGGTPSSLGQSLFGIAGLNQNAALLNQRNSGSLWSGIGSIAAILANSGR